MTVTTCKLSIVGVVLILLAGCSSIDEMQIAQQAGSLQNVGQAKVKTQSALESCSANLGSPHSYSKIILVAGTTSVPDVASDLPGLASLTSKRLYQHLDSLDRFKVMAAHKTSFESTVLDTAESASQLGRQFASQFVVKLELQDLTMISPKKWFSLFNKRNVAIQLNVYDTAYGSLFDSQLYQGTVSGDVVGYPGNGITVSMAWFNTELGVKVDGMLKDMSMRINEKLACVPFSTAVTAIKGGNIYIDAGYNHGIRPGEKLRVYRRSEDWTPYGNQKKEEKGGWIKVDSVFPNHSIAAFAANNNSNNRLVVDVDDVVRAW